MPSNLRSKSQSGPAKRSCVKVAAIGSSHSGVGIGAVIYLRDSTLLRPLTEHGCIETRKEKRRRLLRRSGRPAPEELLQVTSGCRFHVGEQIRCRDGRTEVTLRV